MTAVEGREVEFTYDPFGRLAETKFPQADVASPVNTFKRTTYDKRGQAMAEEDQNGNITEFGFDELGRLESVTDAEEHTWTYGYDKGGAQISQTDANDHTTSWTYDQHGRKLTRTLPMGQTETFHYDIAGNMFEHHRFDHEEFVNDSVMMYDFDGSGREVGRFDPEISTSTVTTAYDLGGRRVKVVDHLGTTRYEYDLRGRLTAEIKFSGEALVYEYDQQGNQTRSLVYSDDSLTTELMETVKTYDRLNRLETVESDPGTWTYTYNEVGSRAAQINPNGTRTDYEYDDLNRLRKIHTYKDNASPTPDVDINVFEYTLDNVGNRTHIYEYQNTGSSIVEATLDYIYDDTYKLLSEERTDEISHDQVYLREYEYDPVGNRLLQRTTDAEENVEERTYPAETAYDANDRLLEERVDDEVVTTYQYDDRGNTTAKIDAVDEDESVFYTWDHENRFVGAEKGENEGSADPLASYAYDHMGIRIEKTLPVDGTTHYLVDYRSNTGCAQVIHETDTSADEVVRYVYGDDLLSQIRADVPSFYHYDGIGSTRGLISESGTATDGYIYYAFGDVLHRVGASTNDSLFSGERNDATLHLLYLRARYYNAAIGRFASSDSFPGRDRTPFTLHKYMYGLNNPLRMVDPGGLEAVESVVWDLLVINEPSTYSGRPFSDSVAGPDVTVALNNTLDEASAAWAAATPDQKFQYFTHQGVFEIYPLYFLGKGDPEYAKFGSGSKFGKGGGEEMIQFAYGGGPLNVYNANAVNYALWGRINSEIYSSLINNGTIMFPLPFLGVPDFSDMYTEDYAVTLALGWKVFGARDIPVFSQAVNQAVAFTRYGYSGKDPSYSRWLGVSGDPENKASVSRLTWMWYGIHDEPWW